jgi:hypothetical protein
MKFMNLGDGRVARLGILSQERLTRCHHVIACAYLASHTRQLWSSSIHRFRITFRVDILGEMSDDGPNVDREFLSEVLS